MPKVERDGRGNLRFEHTRPRLTLGQRAADKMTLWVGSWTFIVVLFIILALWVSVNIIAWAYRFDPYPFILMNLFHSCLAAVQAPIILMSQNRAAERDRAKSDRDFTVNRRAEREVANMQADLEEIKELVRKVIKK